MDFSWSKLQQERDEQLRKQQAELDAKLKQSLLNSSQTSSEAKTSYSSYSNGNWQPVEQKQLEALLGKDDVQQRLASIKNPSSSGDVSKRFAIKNTLKRLLKTNTLKSSDVTGSLYRSLRNMSRNTRSYGDFITQLTSWENRVGAEIGSKQQKQQRYDQLEKITSQGFFDSYKKLFPTYDPTAKHSFHSEVGFDTETSDSGKILELAGAKVIWNETAQRFELPQDLHKSLFSRYYIPKDLDKDITKTYDVHGYDAKGLGILRRNQKASYSLEFDEAERKRFLEEFAKGSILTGHNIRRADIPWLLGKDSYSFNLRDEDFKQSYLDTLDLAEAIFGKSKPGEGRNTLQNLAKHFKVSATDLGLPVHAAWADVLVNLKVKEKLLQTYSDDPAVIEYKAAMNSTDVIHSHRWEQPDPIDIENQRSGFVTHKAVSKNVVANLTDALKVKVSDFVLNGLGISSEEYNDAIKANGSYDLSDYEEMPMSDNVDKEEVDSLKEYIHNLGYGSSSNESYRRVEHMVRELRAVVNRYGEGWDKPDYKVSKEERPGVDAIFRTHWASSWSKSFENEVLHKALQANHRSFVESQDKLHNKLNAQREKLLDFYSGGYIGIPNLRSEQYFQDMLNRDVKEKPLSEAEMDVFKYRIKEMLGKQKAEAAKNAHNSQLKEDKSDILKAQSYYLNDSQIKHFQELTEDASESLRSYNTQLRETIKGNERLTRGLREIASAGRPFYDVSRVYNTIEQGAGEVGNALIGLTPRFLRDPAQRLNLAFQQTLNPFLEAKKNTWSQLQNVGNILSASGVAAATMFPGGQMIGAGALLAGAGLNLGSNIIGGLAEQHANKQFKSFAANINLVSSGLQMLIAPLGLLKRSLGGFLNIWAKMGSILSVQYGVPLTNLTGITSPQYSTMLDADTFFGMKQGSLNAMANTWANDQAALYGSGQVNQGKLVAAARLGVFNSVYAPLGGDSVDQMSATVTQLLGQMKGQNKAQKQQTMYLAGQIDSSLPNILQRMELFRDYKGYKGSFKDLMSGKGYGVWQRNMSTGENANWEWAAGQYGATRHQFTMGLKRIATPLWNNYGLPIANLTNQSLNSLADALSDPSTMSFSKFKDIAKNFWEGLKTIFGFEGKGVGDIWSSLKSSFSKNLGELLANGISIAIDLSANIWQRLFNYMRKPLSDFMDYVSSIDMSIEKDPNSLTGFSFKFTSPEQKLAKVTNNLAYDEMSTAQLYADNSWLAKKYISEDYKTGLNKTLKEKYGISIDNMSDISDPAIIHALTKLRDNMEVNNFASYRNRGLAMGYIQKSNLLKPLLEGGHIRYDSNEVADTVLSMGSASIVAASGAIHAGLGTNRQELRLVVEGKDGAKITAGDATTANKVTNFGSRTEFILK